MGLVTLPAVKKVNFQALIKLAVSAASPTAWGATGRRPGWRTTGTAALPCKSREAALAADFITALFAPRQVLETAAVVVPM